MAQQVDQASFFSQTAQVEVHVAIGSNPNNNPADPVGAFVDPSAYGSRSGFAEYLTCEEISNGRLGCCESLLRRVRKHNPKAAKLIEQYRLAVIRQATQSEKKTA